MIADAIIPPPEIYKSEIGSHLRCARSIPIIRRTILLLKETTTPLATQKILPRTRFILHVVPISIRTSDSSQMENRTEEGKNRKDKKRKQGKERKQNHTVVILTLTRIIKSVVTGQAPVTLELRNTPGKKHKPKVVHAYITEQLKPPPETYTGKCVEDDHVEGRHCCCTKQRAPAEFRHMISISHFQACSFKQGTKNARVNAVLPVVRTSCHTCIIRIPLAEVTWMH